MRTPPTSTVNSRPSKPTSNLPTRSNLNSSAKSPTPNGVCAASLAWKLASWPLPSPQSAAWVERLHPERLQPGYDGETLLLGSAMIDRTDALGHLARYDGHLSRRFFRAVKQLRDLRRDEREAHQARSSAGSYTQVDPDPYGGRYVPAQAPPPIDPPSPTAARIGFRASRESAPQTALRHHRSPAPQATLTEMTKRTQSRRTLVESTADCRSTSDRAAGGSPRSSVPGLALESRGSANHSLTVAAPADGNRSPRSRAREQAVSFKPPSSSVMAKQTQSRRTAMESMASSDETGSADLAVEIRGLCSVPALTATTSLSGAASPHRSRNQHSHRVKTAGSFVAQALSAPRRDLSRLGGTVNHKGRNKPNSAEPPCKQQLPGQRRPYPHSRSAKINRRYSRPGPLGCYDLRATTTSRV